jgi:glyoxylase-like metal-dependent hydrolase (beta-lactamase superfamily II)
MTTWDDFAIVPPHTEFDEAITLPGDTEVRHVGGRHAEDSTVVAVPDAGVLLLGDCCYPPPYHLREPDDGYDLTLIRRLLHAYPPEAYEWWVASHDEPQSAARLLRSWGVAGA